MSKLKYISESILADLKANVPSNLERYRSSGFDDQADLNGWSMELSSVEVDNDRLRKLDPSGGSDAEVSNSLIVFGAFNGMTPALATEERVWSRMTHFDCLDYARQRWPIRDEPKETGGLLGGLTGARQKAAEKRKKVHHQNVRQIETHYFARGRTGYRDDHAVARLWWNAFIAWRVDPQDQAGVLRELLRTADIRSNLVERPMLSNRASLLRGIIQTMSSHPEVYGTEATFREFMKALNLRGSGVLFESLSGEETAEILLRCRDDALRSIQKAQKAA
ncbi:MULTISPECIES: DUF6339 family protein [unclassified Ruegeria]|uniref:DUF6339 family protein n=1 Tax=unclassified Ruegeria TaxID=2625375 RepID=UPI00147E6E69|nr:MULTISPECIES: DUF6339 family protein [unclassified Ruegeria]NOD62045.1 hypothetical protein [Ruegeria sp. HKCCD6109]